MSNMAIAYNMSKKRKKMAAGGEIDQEDPQPSPSPSPAPVNSVDADAASKFRKSFQSAYSKGGKVNEKASGYLALPEEHELDNADVDMEDDKHLNQRRASMRSEADHESPIVDRIMKKRNPEFDDLDRYSEGGRIANEKGPGAEDLEAEFDDLSLRDDLEFSYDSANSGDELGNEGEDERRHDIVSRVMASRKKKDKNPRPA